VCFQIFTNGDMIHAVRALKRLGLEDCFEGIICFETLNPPCLLPSLDQATPQVFDIAGHFAGSGGVDELPRTPVLCKPNVGAMEAALRIANVNPYKAVCVLVVSVSAGCSISVPYLTVC
jgi:putative hydrolase of the HAD superfamily